MESSVRKLADLVYEKKSCSSMLLHWGRSNQIATLRINANCTLQIFQMQIKHQHIWQEKLNW